MDRLFQESPGGRRRFLDRLVLALHPGHAVHSARYEAAMRSRTTLLTADQHADHVWLTALEAQMAEHGSALALARRDTVAALGEALAQRSEEHTSELQSLMRISYAVFCSTKQHT